MVKPWVFIAFVLIEAYVVAQGVQIVTGRLLFASASPKAQAASIGLPVVSLGAFWIAGIAGATLGRMMLFGSPTGPPRGAAAKFTLLLLSIVLLGLGGLQVSFFAVDSDATGVIPVAARAVGLLVLLGSCILLVVALSRTKGARKVVRASSVKTDVELDVEPLPGKEDS